MSNGRCGARGLEKTRGLRGQGARKTTSGGEESEGMVEGCKDGDRPGGRRKACTCLSVGTSRNSNPRWQSPERDARQE